MERFTKKVIQEVPMVESQATNLIKRKVNLPAAVFSRSPIKQTENKSIISNRPLTPSKKPLGLSPSKIRPEKSLKASNCPRPSATREVACSNHENKVAQFLVETEDEQLPYCQKCSILLASQGFKLIKLNRYEEESNPLDILENNPRKRQIQDFLDKLDGTNQKLEFLRSDISSKLTNSHKDLQEKIQEVEMYYQYFMESIERHKFQTIQLLSQHVSESQTQVKSASEMIEECIKDSESMKNDILTSIEIIKEAGEEDFRPVMNSYYEKLQNFQECIEQVKNCNIPLMVLSFNSIEEVSKQSLDMIQIGFEQVDNRQSDRSNSYFSFDAEEGEQETKQEIKPKGSSIFPNAKPSTAADQKTLRSSNIMKQKLGYSINQL